MISLNDLLRVMNVIVGTNIQAIYEEERAGDVRDSQADITKARTLLGYEPIVSFEEGLLRGTPIRPMKRASTGHASHATCATARRATDRLRSMWKQCRR